MGKEPLLRLLAGAGIASRRKLADAIKAGRVAVTGEVAASFQHLVARAADIITIDGEEIKCGSKPKIYLILTKPAGGLSTVSDEKGRKTVLDILLENYKKYRLYPAGRLDKESTGLILLTDDGELTHRITHPSFEHEKEYHLCIRNKLTADETRRLEKGIKLEDGVTSPAKVNEIKGEPSYNYSITLHEGRKRQVRRMFEALGHNVLKLKRVRIGGLLLGDLKEGETRRLTEKEARKAVIE